MATIKSYTNLSQSRKLAKILPIESADMFWADGKRPAVWNNKDISLDETDIPCWSLAALLEQLPYKICDDEGNSAFLSIDRENYQLVYNPCSYSDFGNIETDVYEDFVDACYEMIMKLHEQKLL